MGRIANKLFKLTYNRKISQLPTPYLDFLEKSLAPAERVHDEDPKTKYLDYNQDHDSGYVYRVPDHRIDVSYPQESQIKGLWGGLGMVEGYVKPKRMRPRYTRVWYPTVERHTFYSEILDYHINVEVTDRTLQLIDENQGFDFYILNTRPQDLKSLFGTRLQRKMLLALAGEPNDFVKQKYGQYIKPLEEVRWIGLDIHDALTRAKVMRVEEGIEPPLKLTYGRQYLDELKKQKSLS